MVRKNLKQFFGFKMGETQISVGTNTSNINLLQSIRRKTEILEDTIRVIKLKSKINKDKELRYIKNKHCTSKQNTKNNRVKVKKDTLNIYSVNSRSINNKQGSIRNIVESGCADIYFFSEINCNKVPNFKGHLLR